MNINKYKNKMFFAPDEGSGEGGGGDPGGESVARTGELSRGSEAFEPVTKQTTGERPLPKSSGSSGAGTEHAEGVQKDTSAAPAGGFDASKFAKEFGDSLSTTLKPILDKATPPEPKMSPEEAKKLLNIWEPDDQWYKKYDNLETRADAVKEMRDGIALQADTLHQLRLQEEISKLRDEFLPHFEAVKQAENAQRETRFQTLYPQIGKPELQPLVKAIANDMVEKGQTFKTEKELFKALANGVEAVIKVNNPEFKLTEAGATENGSGEVSGRGGRQLPVTTPGGGGGTGRREVQKETKSRGLSVFD